MKQFKVGRQLYKFGNLWAKHFLVPAESADIKSSFTRHRIGRFTESIILPYTTVAIHFKCECSHETAVDRVR
jgi:hypothetical protein